MTLVKALEVPHPAVLSPVTSTGFIFTTDADPFNDRLCSARVLSNTTGLLSHKAVYLTQVYLPSPCHALIPVFNSLTSDRSRGGSGGDFNTKSLPLSLPGCATAYQRPLSDVGNPGPCPPNPCRPGRLFCPNQTENYRTGTARADINEAPGSLCPLCGQEERSLDINLSLSLSLCLACFLPLSPSHHASRISGLSVPLGLNQTGSF